MEEETQQLLRFKWFSVATSKAVPQWNLQGIVIPVLVCPKTGTKFSHPKTKQIKIHENCSFPKITPSQKTQVFHFFLPYLTWTHHEQQPWDPSSIKASPKLNPQALDRTEARLARLGPLRCLGFFRRSHGKPSVSLVKVHLFLPLLETLAMVEPKPSCMYIWLL